MRAALAAPRLTASAPWLDEKDMGTLLILAAIAQQTGALSALEHIRADPACIPLNLRRLVRTELCRLANGRPDLLTTLLKLAEYDGNVTGLDRALEGIQAESESSLLQEVERLCRMLATESSELTRGSAWTLLGIGFEKGWWSIWPFEQLRLALSRETQRPVKTAIAQALRQGAEHACWPIGPLVETLVPMLPISPVTKYQEALIENMCRGVPGNEPRDRLAIQSLLDLVSAPPLSTPRISSFGRILGALASADPALGLELLATIGESIAQAENARFGIPGRKKIAHRWPMPIRRLLANASEQARDDLGDRLHALDPYLARTIIGIMFEQGLTRQTNRLLSRINDPVMNAIVREALRTQGYHKLRVEGGKHWKALSQSIVNG